MQSRKRPTIPVTLSPVGAVMRRAQVLIHESDGVLAGQLRPLAEERCWLVREVRRGEELEELLPSGGVLVLKVGRNLESEFALLERVSRLHPGTGVVVVGDGEHLHQRPRLAGLAWDLGASYVLFPPLPKALLGEVVAGLMGPERTRDDRTADPG
jgi:hypothetical protein